MYELLSDLHETIVVVERLSDVQVGQSEMHA